MMVLRLDPRGWGCKRGRQVESHSIFFFSVFGYVGHVLARTVPTDLAIFADAQGEPI
jgi:hypothetical protein